jgi:hypothetical protein
MNSPAPTKENTFAPLDTIYSHPMDMSTLQNSKYSYNYVKNVINGYWPKDMTVASNPQHAMDMIRK